MFAANTALVLNADFQPLSYFPLSLFNGEDAVSRGFLDVIQRDLVATLRETLRPSARLAASV